MIPDEIDLPADARHEIEQIDDQLEDLDRREQQLLDRRSQIIEEHAE